MVNKIFIHGFALVVGCKHVKGYSYKKMSYQVHMLCQNMTFVKVTWKPMFCDIRQC